MILFVMSAGSVVLIALYCWVGHLLRSRTISPQEAEEADRRYAA